jgi:hypothetical protein
MTPTTSPPRAGFFTPMNKRRKGTGKERWTDLEVAIMQRLFPDTTNAMLGRVLRRSRRSLTTQAHKMGLKKSEAHMQREYAMRVQRSKEHPKTFKPGQAPWNFGLKGSTGLHPATRQNHFKPGCMYGNARHRWVPVGTLRIDKDGLLSRKWTDDRTVPSHQRWAPVHRLVWEQAHGPVPKGFVVVFRHPSLRTTQEREITLDKLVCISRSENMRRNSYWTNLSPEVARLVHLKGIINRRIRHMERTK